MTPAFQVGDRVRLAPSSRHPEFHPGETGKIVAVIPPPSSNWKPIYQVRMDKGKAALYPAFYPEELEFVQ